MALLWQHVVVTGAAVGATLWLARDWRRRRAAKAGCEKCALRGSRRAAETSALPGPTRDPAGGRR